MLGSRKIQVLNQKRQEAILEYELNSFHEFLRSEEIDKEDFVEDFYTDLISEKLNEFVEVKNKQDVKELVDTFGVIKAIKNFDNHYGGSINFNDAEEKVYAQLFYNIIQEEFNDKFDYEKCLETLNFIEDEEEEIISTMIELTLGSEISLSPGEDEVEIKEEPKE